MYTVLYTLVDWFPTKRLKSKIQDPISRGVRETGLAGDRPRKIFEIQFLGVFGKPENRRPAEKKIRDRIFRGARETGEPETG